MEEKKLRKSKIVIALYAIAVLILAYSLYQAGSTIAYITSYYSAYGMTAGVGETVGYVLSAIFQPLVFAILTFAAGYILNEVRALNPDYYASDAEVAAAKEEKKARKLEKKLEKAEEKAEEKSEKAEKSEKVSKEEEKEEKETIVFEEKPAKKAKKK